MRPILMIPGYGGSGPGHWQTLWEPLFPDVDRVELPNVFAPKLIPWVEALDVAIQRALEAGPPVLVAHDVGCLLVAHWSERYSRDVHGALLVAPPDPHQPHGLEASQVFAPLPTGSLPFPCRVVGSGDDPYVSIEQAKRFADTWGATFTDLGFRGHINTASGHGEWPKGQVLLRELLY